MPNDLDPVRRTIAAYDAHATAYARVNAGLTPVRHLLDNFMRLIPPRTGPLRGAPGWRPTRVLDVGCGHGRDAAYLSAHRYQVVGIDLSRGQLACAVDNAPQAAFQQANMLTLPFRSGVFDGVWACASLLHLLRDQVPQALGEIRRVIRPAGLLYASVQIGEGSGWQVADHFGGAARFYTYFGPGEIAAYVQAAGFRVVQMTNSERWIDIFARAE
ncbi:MAG: hypothetical protein Kow0077_17820 [Anaerolineae bacterium]